ncbi:MAG: hypothetical protein ACOX45_07340 [Acutalibacteraceae bacterium]
MEITLERGIKIKKADKYINFIILTSYLISVTHSLILPLFEGSRLFNSFALFDMLCIDSGEGEVTTVFFLLYTFSLAATIAVFVISLKTTDAFSVSLKETDLLTKAGILLFPVIYTVFLLIADFFRSRADKNSGVLISAFFKLLIAAAFIFIAVNLIRIMRANPDSFHLHKNGRAAFLFYTAATAAAQICFIIINLSKSNEALLTVLGTIAFTSVILMTNSALWLFVHYRKNVLTYISIFAQTVVYIAFYTVHWYKAFDLDRTARTAVFIVLFLLSGGIGIFRYRKAVQSERGFHSKAASSEE